VKHRFAQFVLIVSTLATCWLGMQVVHELGHVVAALVCGERIERVVIHPLVLSRTDVSHDRHPLVVIWGGAVVGSVVPVLILGMARALLLRRFYLFQFFAGFCLIANGVYLGVGSFVGAGDAGDLIQHGSPIWMLIVFGLGVAPAGLWLWNGLGPHFGLGQSDGEVDQVSVGWTVTVLLLIVVAESLTYRR
jgi:hypothetical protein